MKKLFAAILALACTVATAGPYDLRLIQQDSIGNSMIPRLISFPSSGGCVISLEDANKTLLGPSCLQLSGDFAISAGTVSFATPSSVFAALSHNHATTQLTDMTAAGRAIAQAADASAMRSLLSTPSTSDMTAALAGKADTSTVTASLATKFATPAGSTAQYLRGDGSLATFPTIPTVPIINRTRVTTAADGTYIWMLPTPCAVGTNPVVSVTPESSTAGDAISHRVTATTNTAVYVFAGRSAALTVLSLTVLGIPTGAAVPVHLLAVCP